ncbi:MAG: flagellar basal body rod protein FlgB [Anaerolineae bacterium]|jgi:flagellar basal-body rod protein FlgB
MSDLINDRAIRTLRYALDGLSLRQQAIAQNMANLNTPGYKAARVSFEQELQRLISQAASPQLPGPDGGPSPAEEAPQITVTRDESTSMRLDGNNVDIDWEMAHLAETVINYNTVTELVSMKLAILKGVMKSM